MARTIAIEPRRSINAARASGGAILLSGALSHQVSAGPPVSIPPVFKNVTGALSFTGSVARQTLGPSIETKSQFVSGAIVPTGSYDDDVVVGPPIGISTKDINGSLELSGTVAGEASGPSLVTIQRLLNGFIGISSTLAREAISPPPPTPTTLTQDVDGTITPAGDVATAVSGPSFVTLTQNVNGTITPAGALTTDTIAPPVTEFFKTVGGTISPASSLATQVSGPSLVTVPKSVGGAIPLTGTNAPVIVPTLATKTQSAAGTVLSAGALSTAVSGPSFVTKTKAIGGTISPVGAKSDVVVPPPPTFFSKALVATITPSGTLATLKTGPSFETKPKAVFGLIVPSSTLAKAVTGPSFEIKPKAVAGLLTPHGALTTQITNNPAVIKRTITGSITPHGARSATVIGGPPGPVNPMYCSMADWEIDEFDRFPQWMSIMFTSLASTTSACKQQLDAMRARGMKGGLAITVPGMMADRRADNTLDFNMSKFQALVDRVAAIPGVETYVADKTLEYFCFGDELQHPKWNGTIPPDTRKAMAKYVMDTLPAGIKSTVRMPSDRLKGIHLPTGGWEGYLSAGWAQYTGPFRSASVGMTALQFYTSERTAQLALGIPEIILGANWWNGGDGSSGVPGPRDDPDGGEDFWVMSDVEIKGCVDAAITITAAKYFLFWTDAFGSGLGGAADMRILQDRADYRAAWQYAKDTGLNRGGVVAPPDFFVDTGFFTAPHPPPTIALGKAVRDTLTNHKVFRLVDGARTQDAEYPSLNADNSVIYYIKGTTGFIADVVWNVAQSSVQVTNERVCTLASNPPAVADGWIWNRTDRRYGYFTAQPGPARICRRDIVLGTTAIIKNCGNDPNYSAFWNAAGVASSALRGLHANRNQEVFAAIVQNNANGLPVGVVIWSSLNNAIWNYQAIAGKTITRVLVDDPGLYITVQYSDGSWQVGRMDTGGILTKSLNVSGPLRYDFAALNGGQQVFHVTGLGVKTRDVDPLQLTDGNIYNHPQRSSKQDLYQQGMAGLTLGDDVIGFLYYDTTIATAWTVESGAVWKINWSAEMAARTFKGVPEVVRQGSTHLTKVIP